MTTTSDKSWFQPEYQIDPSKFQSCGWKVEGAAVNLLSNTLLKGFSIDAKSMIIYRHNDTDQVGYIELYMDAKPWAITPKPRPFAAFNWSEEKGVFYPAKVAATPVDQTHRLLDSNERLIKALLQVGDCMEKSFAQLVEATAKAFPVVKEVFSEPIGEEMTPVQELVYYAMIGIWHVKTQGEHVPAIEKTANTSCKHLVQAILNRNGRFAFTTDGKQYLPTLGDI